MSKRERPYPGLTCSMSQCPQEHVRPYPGLTCSCGHWDMVHFNWVGECLHGTEGFIPRDNPHEEPCRCKGMA